MTFAETWAPDAAGDLEVIVEDADSGRKCCYRVDLGSGEAEPRLLAAMRDSRDI